MLFVKNIRRFKHLWPLPLLCILLIGLIETFLINDDDDDDKRVENHRPNSNPDHGKRIQVIVGHYNNNMMMKNKINLTRGRPAPLSDNLNTDSIPKRRKLNNFNPQKHAGKNGEPVVIATKDLFQMQQLFQINRFNIMASDQIPLNRTLPDVRKKRCQNAYKHISTLPKSSVIIVFHNEAWSTLLRTVSSVINRSPTSLLEEIILVDDASERDFLKLPLDRYVAKLPVKTRIIRSVDRIGLIKARVLGANNANGQVLTFLDAHCECTIGWLESLLDRIATDPSRVVCPVIDIISDDTFAYIKSFELHWGALNWHLHFRWYTLPGEQLRKRKKDIIHPFRTPTMAGGLFAIDREYFFKIGAYDTEMKIWGGENLEMSFRIWQCGGSIEIVPCSHVGHIFRKSSPYEFPAAAGVGDILYSNLARVALVWMDEWAQFYFKFNGNKQRQQQQQQNVTDRLALRRKLHCNTFEWYLRNVWPEHFFPMADRFFGRIRNVEQNQCLLKPMGKGVIINQPMGVAKLNQCLQQDNLIEMFVFTPDGMIMTDESVCLDAPEKKTFGGNRVRIMACSGFKRQRWKYNTETQSLVHISTNKCLDISKSNDDDDDEGLVVITNCTRGILSQQWILEAVSWK